MFPKKYEWLAKEGGPQNDRAGAAHLRDCRDGGPEEHADILAWAKEVELGKTYTADSIPWCALGGP